MKTSPLALIAIFAAAFFHCCVSSNLIDEYKKNPPVYCADPSDRSRYEKTRRIPPLGSTEADLEGLKLKQVQVFTRSGSRTVSQDRKCWKDFKPQHDCQSGEVAIGWTRDWKSENVTLPFPKYFDADTKSNKLKNTACELGQLDPMGHEQHRLNGEFLADAYFKVPTVANDFADLIGDQEDNKKVTEIIYFRSTDFERTRMSGVELLSSMVKTVDPSVKAPRCFLSMAEQEADNLLPNSARYPSLVDATHQAFSSKEFVAKFEKKHEMARALAAELMGIEADFKKGLWPWEPLDCLGVALCSGFDLPTGEKWTRENVDVIHAAAIEESGWRFLANNSRYSKIANARFTYDVKGFAAWQLCGVAGILDIRLGGCMDRIFGDLKEAANVSSYLVHNSGYDKHPFVYRSVHETTMSSFLAAFGEQFWSDISIDYIKKNSKFEGLKSPYPSYASLLVLEFYELKEDFLFRMIYNGRVITQHVPGCTQDKELCSVKTFFKAMAWATRDLALDPSKGTPKPVKPIVILSKASALVPATFMALIGLSFVQV